MAGNALLRTEEWKCSKLVAFVSELVREPLGHHPGLEEGAAERQESQRIRDQTKSPNPMCGARVRRIPLQL